MLWPALAAAIAAGGWYVITAWPLQLFVALRQKETPVISTILGILHPFRFILDHPLPVAGLTGLLIGDFATAIHVGAIVQLMFLGVFIVGAAIPPRPMVATIMAVVFVSQTGAEVGEVLPIVVPVAILSQMLFMGLLTINTVFYNRFALKPAQEGNVKTLELAHAILQPVFIFLVNGVPAFLGVYFGTGLVETMVQHIPDWLSAGMGMLAGVLPVLGFGLLVYTMNPGILIVLFVVGFILGSATELPPLALAALIVGIVVFFQYMLRSKENGDDEGSIDLQGEKISLNDRLTLWWRNNIWYYAASWDVLGGWGFGYQMAPFIRRFYPNKEDRAEALQRHIAFWNTNVHGGAIIPGMVAAMEKGRSEDKEAISGEAIQGIKVAAMGPMAGIGDSIYHATLTPIMLALGTAMVQDGSSFGWIFPIVSLFIIFAGSIWYLLGAGYNLGAQAFTTLGGLMDRLAEGAKITGLIIAGAMVARLASINFDISYTAGEEVIDLQEILDGLMPNLPVLAAVFLVYWALRRGVSSIWLVLIIMVLTILGSYFGLLG